MISFKSEFEIKKMVAGRDKSAYGAFASGTKLILEALLPRSCGAYDLRLELTCDGGNTEVYPMVYPMEWKTLRAARDVYSVSLSLDTAGLYFYRIVYFCEGGERAFPNVLEDTDIFQLTVYDKNVRKKSALLGGIMYQIFPDRFARAGERLPREGASLNPDWEHGIPQYGEYPGAPVANNEFFGGDLDGVAEKLDYLASLGVTCIYLNPIFEAATNHRYDIGDYMKVDPLLGGEEALEGLIAEAKKRGIKIILDGVFNHTGDDSRYFNRYGNYPTLGAYQSKASPYYDWYNFRDYPNEYECWWGVDILPAVNENNPDFRRLICGEDGVVRKYIRMGIGGWRLDVADELPDSFIAELRSAAEEESPDSIILGEVWEDASNKVAYGVRRRYFQGCGLDSVMNYPLRNAIIDFILFGDSEGISRTERILYEHYPKHVSDLLMNILGTHDTERILNVLGEDDAGERTNRELSSSRMSSEARALGAKRLRCAYFLLATLPGVPCIYYGDEAGLEGYRDPFNRRPFPWGREDEELVEWYRRIGALRRMTKDFADGEFEVLSDSGGLFVFRRKSVIVCVNSGLGEAEYSLPHEMKELLTGQKMSGKIKLGKYEFSAFK